MTDVLARLGAALADRYRLERELGQGGMATVYLAEDLKHDRKVAVTVLRPELAAVIGAETAQAAETVRKWVRQAQIDAGSRAGPTSEESAELKKLRREVAELRRANAILKTASAFFAAELDRPQH